MTIAEFLLKLANDERLLESFKADAQGFLRGEAGEGLDDRQKELLQAGELVRLSAKIKAEFMVDGERIAFITIYGPPPP